ncbi:MAG: hypothetical protein ABII79_02905 [bacterium]
MTFLKIEESPFDSAQDDCEVLSCDSAWRLVQVTVSGRVARHH